MRRARTRHGACGVALGSRSPRRKRGERGRRRRHAYVRYTNAALCPRRHVSSAILSGAPLLQRRGCLQTRGSPNLCGPGQAVAGVGGRGDGSSRLLCLPCAGGLQLSATVPATLVMLTPSAPQRGDGARRAAPLIAAPVQCKSLLRPRRLPQSSSRPAPEMLRTTTKRCVRIWRCRWAACKRCRCAPALPLCTTHNPPALCWARTRVDSPSRRDKMCVR